jgi:organic radical activating enzyme
MEPTATEAPPVEQKNPFRAYSISWNLTKRCNLNCDHCYLDADFRGGFRTDELNTEECFRVVDQIAEVNPNAFLILTGGEPKKSAQWRSTYTSWCAPDAARAIPTSPTSPTKKP